MFGDMSLLGQVPIVAVRISRVLVKWEKFTAAKGTVYQGRSKGREERCVYRLPNIFTTKSKVSENILRRNRRKARFGRKRNGCVEIASTHASGHIADITERIVLIFHVIV